MMMMMPMEMVMRMMTTKMMPMERVIVKGWEIYRMLHISADNASDLDHFLVASNLSNLITCPATLDHIQLTLAF